MNKDTKEISQLNPELLTIGELFADKETIYTVPIYQRNYAWKAVHIEQLLIDINDVVSHDVNNSYFLGNLMVTKRPPQGTINYEVIDGQQRLTTLYLLLTFLACDTNHQNSLRYESRPRATEALMQIASESSCATLSTHSHIAEDSGICQGYNVIKQFMEQHIQGEARVKFTNFLLTNVTVVRASLPSKTDFNRYFEIMNTRGEQLQQVDIVKARLMGHLKTDAERDCFAWIWNACSDMDSYVQMSLTRGDTKWRGNTERRPKDYYTELRTKIFGNDWSWLSVKSFEDLSIIFHTDNNAPLHEDHSSEPLTLDKAIERYAKIDDSKKNEDPENVRFRSIITFPSFLLHVLKVMRPDLKEDEGQLDDKVLVQRFAEFIDKQDSEKALQIQKFIFELLRCRNLFDGYILKRQYTATNGDEGDWSLQCLIRGGTEKTPTLTVCYKNTFSDAEDLEEDGIVDSKTNDLLILQSMLRVTYTSPRAMHWITRLLKLLVMSGSYKVADSTLAADLRNYARQKVRVAFFNGEQPQGFSINRIVFTYLDYLLIMKKDIKKRERSNFRFSFRNSIEHFYPQNPVKEQLGDGVAVSPECLHLLGNLALVSVEANSKFSNNIPKIKAENYNDSIEKQSPKLGMMAEITRSKNEWGDEDVRAHHDEMVKLLDEDTKPVLAG